MLAYSNFLPHSCSCCYSPGFLQGPRLQFISVSLKSYVYLFQKLKICKFKAFDSDCQISQMPQTETSLYSVPEQQQERNSEDICVPSAFDEFLDI